MVCVFFCEGIVFKFHIKGWSYKLVLFKPGILFKLQKLDPASDLPSKLQKEC